MSPVSFCFGISLRLCFHSPECSTQRLPPLGPGGWSHRVEQDLVSRQLLTVGC